MADRHVKAQAALQAARAHGVKVSVLGTSLALEAATRPPAATLAELGSHKKEIVALLSGGNCNEWTESDWHQYFEERAAVAEFDGGLTRTQAEALAAKLCRAERHKVEAKRG